MRPNKIKLGLTYFSERCHSHHARTTKNFQFSFQFRKKSYFSSYPDDKVDNLIEKSKKNMSARLIKRVLNEQNHHLHVNEEEEDEELASPESVSRSSINPFDLLNEDDSENEKV